MLEFFRKYQRYFFFMTATVVIASFVFFGTYTTFAPSEKIPDRSIGQMVDGSDLMLSDVQKMSRFIVTDAFDSMGPRGALPNLCNDGVIRNDFLNDKLANLLVASYFDQLKADFESRLERAKRFRPYAHPQAPLLSVKGVWDHFLPELNSEMEALQKEKEASFAIFSSFAKLYRLQSRLPPEMLRRILVYQHQQHPELKVDQRLMYEDLAVFGFHSASDWFGRNFVDLVSEFILNAASVSSKKGYRVSLEEAKGDLIHHFQASMEQLQKANPEIQLSFAGHLNSLGFDVKSASEVWQKVLLFRKLFTDIGSSAFIDRLPYKDFAGYANESVSVSCYDWPIRIKNRQDLAELKAYMKAVAASKNGPLPEKICSIEEIEKAFPKLIETQYRADVAEVDPMQIGLKVTLKELWQWQIDEKNWNQIKVKFSLSKAETADERFQLLNALDSRLRKEIDDFTREKIVAAHPEWIEEALNEATKTERKVAVLGKASPNFETKGKIVRVGNIEQKEKRVLPFHEARVVLKEHVGALDGDLTKEENPFIAASNLAMQDLKKNPEDPKWIQSHSSGCCDRLLDQFKLERKQQSILRTSKEDWMKEQAFMMLPDFWSPIHIADDGQIVFFYLEEKKSDPAPILDQLILAKQMLASDAKTYFAQKFLNKMNSKNAIVIPVQKEDE